MIVIKTKRQTQKFLLHLKRENIFLIEILKVETNFLRAGSAKNNMIRKLSHNDSHKK